VYADKILERVTPDTNVQSSVAYLDRLLLFKGVKTEEEAARAMQKDNLHLPTVAYGIGVWHLVNHREDRAREYFENATAPPAQQSGFGSVASYYELQRLLQTVSAHLRFLLAYTLSGYAALAYEVVWTRALTLRMGHSTAAVSSVLAAVLGGMALGALVAGVPAARRTPRAAVRLYGGLEVAIAISAPAVPLVLRLFDPLLARAYGDGEGAWFGPARLLASLAIIAVPAAAMGATFPVAARAVVARPELAGGSVGRLYAANTLGASIGAAVAALVLVPMVGLARTSLIAAAANLFAAGIALTAAGRWPDEQASPARSAPVHRRKADVRSPHVDGQPRMAAAIVTITGGVALANEVIWTRVLALIVGPTIYAFGTMLAIFIAGLATGSALAARVVDRLRHPRESLIVVLIVVASAPLVAMTFVEGWTMRAAAVGSLTNARFADALRTQALAAAALLFPLATALGAALPLSIRAAVGQDGSVARAASVLYGANTAGAIAGALLAGFVLVPRMGLQSAIITTSASALVAAALLLVGSWKSRKVVAPAAALLAAAAGLWLVPRWDMAFLSSGAYKFALHRHGVGSSVPLRPGSVLFHKEGAGGTVDVRKTVGTLALSIDGKVDASTGGDMLTQKLLAHLPLLLHPNPSRVAIIGLGSGVTLGAALAHPVERADVIEISPEVVQASSLFAAENHDALSSPRARLIVGDGRTHVLLTRDRYDVVISEPSNPWMAGVAALFTREFFAGVRRILSAEGIFCQWAHTYDISDADLRSIAATFRSVFPDGTIWLVGAGDLLLIGSPSRVEARLNQLRTAFARPGVARDLAEVDVADADSLLWLYIGGPRELQAYAAGALVQSDDRTALEFSAPKSLIERQHTDNRAVLLALARTEDMPAAVRDAHATVVAASWRNRGLMMQRAEAPDRAFLAFARALELNSSDAAAAAGLVDASAAAGRAHESEALLSRLIQQNPDDVAPRVELSRLFSAQGNRERALEIVEPLMAKRVDDLRPYEQAASLLADAGDVRRLRHLVAYMGDRWPNAAASSYYAAALALMEGRAADALASARAAVATHPTDARLLNLIGAAAATLGRREEARHAFELALSRDPRDPGVYVNLGLLALETADKEAAARWFAEALILDPRSVAARAGLARAGVVLSNAVSAQAP
jgi:spermidine synthase